MSDAFSLMFYFFNTVTLLPSDGYGCLRMSGRLDLYVATSEKSGLMFATMDVIPFLHLSNCLSYLPLPSRLTTA